MVTRNSARRGNDRSPDQSSVSSAAPGTVRGSLAALPSERALIRGGFVDFPGEETMTEEATVPDEGDIFFGMTPEEILLYIETMLFGDPLLEDPALEDTFLEETISEEPILEDPALEDTLLEDSAVEEPLFEDPAIVDEFATDDTVSEFPDVDESTITDEEYEELLLELLLTP